MIIKRIETRAKQLKQKTTKNTLIASFCGLTAISLFVPAFMTKGKTVDYISICFQPKEIHDPYIYKERINKSFALDKKGKYLLDKTGKKKIITKITKVPIGKRFCNEYSTKKVVASFAAEEIENSSVFRTKVKVTGKPIKATNPHAGLFGIGSGLIMGIGAVIYWSATKDLEDNQDSLIHVKRSQLIDEAFRVEQQLDVDRHYVATDNEFIKQGLTEVIKVKYMGDDPLPTQEQLDKSNELLQKKELLRDTSIELELSEMKAIIAKKRKEEAEALKELQKINKTVKEKIQDSNKTVDQTNDQSKEELIDKLKNHEDSWLYTMVCSIKPVMITGSQGSWKSFTAASIALSRIHILGYKLASIVDPHFRKNKTRPWKHLIQHEPLVYGDLINDQDNDQEIWLDINNGINDCLRRWIVDKEDSAFKVSIFDELTGYSRREECKTSAPKLMSSVIADPRKANEGVILITHSLTSSGTGGSEGFSDAIKEGCLHLELKSDNFAKPLYRGVLNGYKDDKGDLIKEKEVTIPHEWFNPDSIKEMFKNG